MNSVTSSSIDAATRTGCSFASCMNGLATFEDSIPDTATESLAPLELSRTYSPYVLGIGSHITGIEAASRHMRQRRFALIARSLAGFSLKVAVLTSVIVISALSQQHMADRVEAVRMQQRPVVPASVEPNDKPDHADPAVDELPPIVVSV